MNTKFRFYTIIAVVLMIGLLSGCGGGGGGSDSGSSTPAPVAATYSVSGVLTQDGEPLSGVTVTLTKPSAHSAAVAVAFSGSQAETTTNENGEYSFSGLTVGAYTVTPSSDDYIFTPACTSVAVDSNENVATSTFTVKDVVVTPPVVTPPVVTPPVTPPIVTPPAGTYKISGMVGTHIQLGVVSEGVQGITITLSGANTGTTTTDQDGHYEFSGLGNGSYTITPSMAGWVFTPSDNSPNHCSLVTINNADLAEQDFYGFNAAAPHTSNVLVIVRLPVTQSGTHPPVAGVAVTLKNIVNNSTVIIVTDANGLCRFSGTLDGHYTITPSLAGYTFAPTNISITTGVGIYNSIDIVATPN